MRGARNGCRFPARTETLHDATTAAPNDTYGLNATDSKAQTVAEAARLFTRRLCASAPLADFSPKIRQAHVAERVIWRNGPLFGQCGIAEKRCGQSFGESRVRCVRSTVYRPTLADSTGFSRITVAHDYSIFRVRFAPESCHGSRRPAWLRRAKSGLTPCTKQRAFSLGSLSRSQKSDLRRAILPRIAANITIPLGTGKMAIGIGRRQFISAALGGAAAWPFPAQAQQGERMRRIGVLSALAADDPYSQSEYEAFLQGLQLGWTDGRNVHIDARWTAGNAANARKFAAELGALPLTSSWLLAPPVWGLCSKQPAQCRLYS
jgi:hypothetical protein